MTYPFLDYITIVIGLILTIGGALLAFCFKMTRSSTRHETCIQNIQRDIAEIKTNVSKLVDSLLSHIDKRTD